jgi:diguanylate cyclase (GGDEF)-like protein
VKFVRLRQIAIVLGLAASAAIVTTTSFLIDKTRLATQRSVEATLEQNGKAVEGIVNRQLLQADSALAKIPVIFPRGLDNGQGAAGYERASRLLQGLNFQNFVFRDLMVADQSGTVLVSARARKVLWSVPVDEVRSVTSTGSSALVGPVRNNMTGEWTWYLVRPITIGGSEMYAAAEIPVASFGIALSNYMEIPGVRILLERKNGQHLASFPHDELQIGKVRPGMLAAAESGGISYPIMGAGGEVAFLGVTRASLHPDIWIRLAVDLNIALADWKDDRYRFILVAAGALGAVVLLCLVSFLVLRREERLEMERRKAEALLADAIAAMPDGFVMWDRDDRLVTCNARFREIYAKSSEFIYPGAHFEQIVRKGAEAGQFPQAVGDIDGFVAGNIAWHNASNGTMERLLADGRWVLVTERRTSNGGIVGIRTDITAFKRALEDLGVANARVHDAMHDIETRNVLFDTALNTMSQGLLMVDADQRIIVHNSRFIELLGIRDWADNDSVTLGALFSNIAHGEHYSAAATEKLFFWQSNLNAEGASGSCVIESDEGQSLSVVQRPMANGGFVATYEDVTERETAEKRIRFLAHHDALTQLPNRVLFRSGLESRIQGLGRNNSSLAVLYLDLDKFKDVNDTLGHPAGDALLEEVAARLRSCLRARDLVARFGGDEFAVGFVSVDAETQALRLADRIIRELSLPYDLSGKSVTIGVSIGCAIAHSRKADPDTLLKNADMALYEAKAHSRGSCRFFEPDMETRLHARLETEQELRHAVWQDQLEVAYQPLIDLASNKTIGFEALLRWNHPERGQLSPAHFIPLAEETGVIRDLGAWCLKKACSDIAKIPGSVKIAVNLSPVQLKTDDLAAVVLSALEESGLAASRLELEITESALLEDDERIVEHLHRLREAGIRIVLDDFGTGYSSLNYLRRFPFNKIKIDKVFITEATTRADCSTIISSIVDLATGLGMTTTAEGIETQEQFDLVRRLGCAEGQGYLLGRPASILSALARFGEDDKVVPLARKFPARQRKEA